MAWRYYCIIIDLRYMCKDKDAYYKASCILKNDAIGSGVDYEQQTPSYYLARKLFDAAAEEGHPDAVTQIQELKASKPHYLDHILRLYPEKYFKPEQWEAKHKWLTQMYDELFASVNQFMESKFLTLK